MYGVRLEDFVEVKSNKTPFDLNDLIHICKRRNNNKREYLFVNRYQGKHVPEDPFYVISLLDTFCAEVKANLSPNEKVLVVGFAETATGIAEYLTYKLSLDKDFKNTIAYYLQTSRENYSDCPKLFTFDEEHSHAVNQYLYCNQYLPYYDRVLFIEDEVTTGNTILNFIEKFKKINAKCKYSVASILNWQNAECRSKFESGNIDRIFLVEGEIKDNLSNLSMVKDNGAVDYFTMDFSDKVKAPITCNLFIPNSRKGVESASFRVHTDKVMDKVVIGLCSYIDQNDSVMVIGTEEFMYYPLMIARDLQTSLGCTVKYRATTRSPISVCSEDGYILKDSITLPSAYDESRQTYLYNMNGDYNKIVVVSDVHMTLKFKQALSDFAKKNYKEIFFAEV